MEMVESRLVEDEEKGEDGEERFVLSREAISQIASVAAKEGIMAYKREQETKWEERVEKVRNSAKTLVIHYRDFKRMKDTSVYSTDTVTYPTLMEIFDGILEDVRADEFNLTSTKKNMIQTGMLMNHVDVQLENYKKECSNSHLPEIQRRYRIVEMMYLREKGLRADEVAAIECIDKSNVYRTLEKAYDDLTVLFFGIDGIHVLEMRQKNAKKKRIEAKKNKGKK
jgi:hypothetical protein